MLTSKMHQEQTSEDSNRISSNQAGACSSKQKFKMDNSIGLKAPMITTLAIATIMMIVMVAIDVEGRYLPTRSDETRLESLKQILRAMLNYNQDTDMMDNTSNWLVNNGVAYEVRPNHARSFYPKRSPESASTYMTENDNNLRSLSYAETPKLNH